VHCGRSRICAAAKKQSAIALFASTVTWTPSRIRCRTPWLCAESTKCSICYQCYQWMNECSADHVSNLQRIERGCSLAICATPPCNPSSPQTGPRRSLSRKTVTLRWQAARAGRMCNLAVVHTSCSRCMPRFRWSSDKSPVYSGSSHHQGCSCLGSTACRARLMLVTFWKSSISCDHLTIARSQRLCRPCRTQRRFLTVVRTANVIAIDSERVNHRSTRNGEVAWRVASRHWPTRAWRRASHRSNTQARHMGMSWAGGRRRNGAQVRRPCRS
jgi:hypothetical protein